MNARRITGVLLVLALLAPGYAAPPGTLAEAETFARRLVERHMYERLGLVQSDGVKKMRVAHDDAARRLILFVPRATHSEPSWQITVTLQPHDGLIGHQRVHQALQGLRWNDYPNDQRTAVQREEYQRALPVLGEGSACVHVRTEKVQAAKQATITGLELTWIPPPKAAWQIEMVANGFTVNLPADGTIRSTAMRDAVDRLTGRMLEALHGAAVEAGFLAAEEAGQVKAFYTAMQALPHHPPAAPAFREVMVAPRALEPAAFVKSVDGPTAGPATAPAAPVALLGVRGAGSTATAEPAPTVVRWDLPSDELRRRAQTMGLTAALPEPVPALTVMAPAGAVRESPGKSQTPIGVRGGGAVAPRARFDPDEAVALLLDPDQRLWVTKKVPGLASHMFIHQRGEWSAVVVEDELGWHMPVVAPRTEFAAALAKILAVPPRAKPAALGSTQSFDARRLLVLRAVFEWQRTLEATAGTELVRQTGFPIEEIGRLFASPRFMSLIAALPDKVQWEVQMVMGNNLLLAVELAALRQQRLVQRLVLNGEPRYMLSHDGARVARLLFAPVEQLRFTVAPRRMIDVQPVLHVVNALAISGPHQAYIRFRPDGHVTYVEDAWLGTASLPWLLQHLLP